MSDIIVFTVKLVSEVGGKPKFESELRLPFVSDPNEQRRAVDQWLELIATGFRIGALSLEATLKSESQWERP